MVSLVKVTDHAPRTRAFIVVACMVALVGEAVVVHCAACRSLLLVCWFGSVTSCDFHASPAFHKARAVRPRRSIEDATPSNVSIARTLISLLGTTDISAVDNSRTT